MQMRSSSTVTGLAVLDVLREERLQDAALSTGRHLCAGLQRLQARRQPPLPTLPCWPRQSLRPVPHLQHQGAIQHGSKMLRSQCNGV